MFYLVTLLVILVLLEGIFYVLLWCISKQLYYMLLICEVFFYYLMSDIDWEVGWCLSLYELFVAGYHLSPAGEGFATPCISLYNDSFTFGSEIAPKAT